MAIAITMNEAAITTITQNMGSLGLICNAGKLIIIVDFRLPIADCRLKSWPTISIRQSTIRNTLVRLFSVVGCSFKATRHFSFAFFFLVSLLASIDCGSDRTSLSRRGFTRGLGHFAHFPRGLSVELRSSVTSSFGVLTGAVAELLCCFTRTIDAFSRCICNVTTQFLARFRCKEKR